MEVHPPTTFSIAFDPSPFLDSTYPTKIQAELRDQEVEKEAVDHHHEDNDHLIATPMPTHAEGVDASARLIWI